MSAVSSSPACPPPPEPPDKASWYAVATRSRHERIVAQQLNIEGIATYFPTVTEMHRWSDRRKAVEMPLFPGYVFLHAALTRNLQQCVAFSRGTVGFIAMQGEPVPIPSEQIETIRRVMSLQLNCLAHPYLKIGQRVRVRGGALDGIEGILVQSNSPGLILSIDAISRSLMVRVQGYCVEPA
jgi:transcriptional antiterminator NusG